MPYSPPSGDNVALNWTGAPYTPPAGDSVTVEFSNTSNEQYIVDVSIGGAFVSGSAAVENLTRYLLPNGADALLAGQPVLRWTQFVAASGIIKPPMGAVVVDNATHYVQPEAILSLALGAPRLLGGQQTITVGGVTAGGVGIPAFYKQTWPGSLGDLSAFGLPGVSPRMVYPYGIAGVIGTPHVQFPPRPEGWLSQWVESPTIGFGTKSLTIAGMDCLDVGYLQVRDRAQTALPPSILGNGIFGDIAVRTTTRRLSPSGFTDSDFSSYAMVQGMRRYLLAKSIGAGSVGDATIANNTPQLFVSGIESFEMPIHNIGYWIQTVLPSGTDMQRFGVVKVAKPPVLVAQGFVGEIGSPIVSLSARTVTEVGSDTAEYGNLSVTFASRPITAHGYFDSAVGDNARIEYSVRSVYPQGSASGFVGGKPWLSYRVRVLQPQGISTQQLAGHKIGGTQYIKPFGDVATLFGARIIPDIEAVYPQGFSGAFGWPFVSNHTQDIFTEGFLISGSDSHLRFGQSTLYNLRQIITQIFDGLSGLVPPLFPTAVTVENRSKAITTFGARADVHGLALVENAARALLPAGIAAPTWPEFYKAGMVTYSIRSLHLDGIEPVYFSTYNAVYNAARVLAPAGFSAQSLGQASAINTRRYFDRIGGMDMSEISLPMIAPRIRTIQTGGGWYAIDPPDVRLPDVQLSTRYIDVAGKEYFGAGAPEAMIHWNIIAPKTNPHDRYGVAEVKNKTPEYHAFGSSFDVYGDTSIRLQWRNMDTEGANMQLFGRAEIADRKKYIAVSGIGAGLLGDKLAVTQTASPPYSLQNIILDGKEDDDAGKGIAPPNPNQVPVPALQQNILYATGFDAKLFGTTKVTANTIRVEPGYQDFTVGNHAITMKIRTIAVSDFPITEVFEPSRPNLSPRTIWAVMEAPGQAVLNHPQGSGLSLHYVDGYGHSPAGSIVARPIISLKHRELRQYHFPDSSQSGYGQPDIFNRLSIVEPPSIKSMRIGWATLPALITLKQFSATDSAVLGSPAVAIPYFGPQTLFASGFDAKLFGQETEAQLFNRTITTSGWESSKAGASLPDDTPYTWQSLHVGAPLPTIPVGTDTNVFGTQWISLKVRDLPMTGWDAFLSEYQLEAFDKRMRVSGTPAVRPFRAIAPVGISVETFGVPNVKPAVMFIRPDGNADQYRKGAQHA